MQVTRMNAPLFASGSPSKWVEYMHEIWSDSAKIAMVKNKNKDYLQRMNAFIVSEYQMFLSSE